MNCLRAARQEHYKEIATRMNEIKGMASDVSSVLERVQGTAEGEINRLQKQANKSRKTACAVHYVNVMMCIRIGGVFNDVHPY